MAWCWTGDKPSPEPVIIPFTGSYMSLGLSELILDGIITVYFNKIVFQNLCFYLVRLYYSVFFFTASD